MDIFVSVTFITLLMMAILLICVNKNNGDKFYHRKSMRVVGEKLIINEMGPYL